MQVVVVGGGITGLTAAFTLQRQGIDVVLLEADDRLGGKILTTEVAGVRIDAGPDAFLVRESHATGLAEELYLDEALVAPATGSASLWLDGALRRLPSRQYLGVPLDLDELAASGIVSDAGVARARLDLTAPEDGPLGDQSVGELIRRRLGDEVMDHLVGPLLGGINAGDPDRLSLEAGVPQLALAAGHHRSLITSITSHLQASARAPGAPVFLTHPDGLGRFVESIATRLGATTRTGWPVRRIERVPGAEPARPWRVVGDHGVVDADAVVLTTPTFAAAGLVADIAPDAAAMLAEVRYASVVMVTFAYRAADVPDFDGSGFLVPRDEGLLMSACSWASSKWAHLGGDGLAFLRVSAGRSDDDRAMTMSDEDLVATLQRELERVVGIEAEPVEVRITRWPASFPQYLPGHLERVAAIDDVLAEEAPGIVVAGAGLRGLGIPACIHQARVAALRVLAHDTAHAGVDGRGAGE